MRLKDFIEETGIPVTRLGERCGLTFHQIYHVVQGGIPTLRSAMAIDHYTKGKVSPKDMLSEKMADEIYGKAEEI